jgi:succinate dehydrogenase hydrophobic anchor subunit
MIDPSLMTLIIVVVTGVVIVVIVLVWLIRTHLKLKHDYQALADVVHGHNNDIADLCAAAVTIDEYMAATNEQINGLCAKISDYQHNEPSTHPYSLVIQKVRSGASVSELMQTGLSQDEAALLIRLHGSKLSL